MIWSKVRIALASCYLLALIAVYCDVFVWRSLDPQIKTRKLENGCGMPAHTGGRYKK